MSRELSDEQEALSLKRGRLNDFLAHANSRTVAPYGAVMEFLSLIEDEFKKASDINDLNRLRLLEDIRNSAHEKSDKMTISDLKLLFNRAIKRTPIPSYVYDIDRRFKNLELEFSQMRNNPEINEKLSKIEKDMDKIRKLIVSPEMTPKEQEDMLKEYKEAEKKVFIIMPFEDIFNDVWIGGIEKGCKNKGYGYLRVDKISLSSWITDDIKRYIEIADYVIADVTGNNPNVMFELGWALALKKIPIVIRQQDDVSNVPFDVKDIRYILYVNTWSGIEKLYVDICKFLQTTTDAEKEKKSQKK